MFVRLLLVFSFVSSVLAAPAASANAEDWSQFRGPTGQGIAGDGEFPTSWSSDSNVIWKSAMTGDGWSSPAISKDRIYLTSAVKPDGSTNELDRSLRTLCVDASNGETLWDREVFQQDGSKAQRIHPKNSHASPTAVIVDDRVYVHFGTHGTACLDLDGKILWKNQELTYRPQHGNGGSPVIFEDLLIVSCDGADVQFMVALDTASGKVRWKSDRPEIPTRKKFSFSTPLVVKINGSPQLISPGTDHVVAYEPRTGKEIWKVEYTGYSVIPRPVYANGLVFVSTSYDRPSLLAIDPTGKGNVTETHLKWKIDRSAPHTPSVIAVGQELYFVSDRGVATCVDAGSGEVYWTKRLGGNFSASPLLAGGLLYFQSEQGETTVVKPGTDYSEVSKFGIEERTLASMAVYGDSFILRSDKNLYRFGRSDK